MANKQNKAAPGQSNFDVWIKSLTPESIADSKFITLSCGGCPAIGEACNKHDTNCRANFLLWARSEASSTEISDTPTAEVSSGD
jgi:hypothetical protein